MAPTENTDRAPVPPPANHRLCVTQRPHPTTDPRHLPAS